MKPVTVEKMTRSTKTRRRARERLTIGWREWVGLPELGVQRIKAKIDTGARTSAIHAWNIRRRQRNGQDWVSFELHPVQRDNRTIVMCHAPVSAVRHIRNSGGQVEERFVIETTLTLGSESWPIDLSLTNRDEMGFRMLLGRAAIRRRVLINPGRSFLTSVPVPGK